MKAKVAPALKSAALVKDLTKFMKKYPKYGLEIDDMGGIPYLFYDFPESTMRVVISVTLHQNLLDSYFSYFSMSLDLDDDADDAGEDPYYLSDTDLKSLVDSVFKEINKYSNVRRLSLA